MGRTVEEITPIEHIYWLEKRVANLEQQLEELREERMSEDDEAMALIGMILSACSGFIVGYILHHLISGV